MSQTHGISPLAITGPYKNRYARINRVDICEGACHTPICTSRSLYDRHAVAQSASLPPRLAATPRLACTPHGIDFHLPALLPPRYYHHQQLRYYTRPTLHILSLITTSELFLCSHYSHQCDRTIYHRRHCLRRHLPTASSHQSIFNSDSIAVCK